MDGELEQLGERIAEAAAHLDAAMHRLLTDLRAFDQGGGWHTQGAMTCAHWLSWRVGWDLVTARERVRVACRLGELPVIDDALRRGVVSYSKVRAMVRVATPSNEALLVEHAQLMTAAQLEKLTRKLALVLRQDEPPDPRIDAVRRYVRRRDMEDGMVKIEAVLHPDEAELVWAMLDHEAARLASERAAPPASDRDPARAGGAARDSAESTRGGVGRGGAADGGGQAAARADIAEAGDAASSMCTAEGDGPGRCAARADVAEAGDAATSMCTAEGDGAGRCAARADIAEAGDAATSMCTAEGDGAGRCAARAEIAEAGDAATKMCTAEGDDAGRSAARADIASAGDAASSMCTAEGDDAGNSAARADVVAKCDGSESEHAREGRRENELSPARAYAGADGDSAVPATAADEPDDVGVATASVVGRGSALGCGAAGSVLAQRVAARRRALDSTDVPGSVVGALALFEVGAAGRTEDPGGTSAAGAVACGARWWESCAAESGGAEYGAVGCQLAEVGRDDELYGSGKTAAHRSAVISDSAESRGGAECGAAGCQLAEVGRDDELYGSGKTAAHRGAVISDSAESRSAGEPYAECDLGAAPCGGARPAEARPAEARPAEARPAGARPTGAAMGSVVAGSELSQRDAVRRRGFDRADALVVLAQGYARGDRPNRSPIEVVVTITADALRSSATSSDGERAGLANAMRPGSGSGDGEVAALGDGFVSTEVARRLACDAGVVEVIEGDHGEPLSVGRKRRTVNGALKRALVRRDGTCTFPGCGHRRFLESHHVRHWADGGETCLSNMAMLCDWHHRFVHEYGFTIELGADGRPRFFDRSGRAVVVAPAPATTPELGWPNILDANRALGIDASTAACGWDGRRADYPAIVQGFVTE